MNQYHVLEYSAPSPVDGVLLGVKIIGTKSSHGYTYPMLVLKRAVKLYEGAPVFVLHPDAREKSQGHRQLRDHLGDLRSVRATGDGIYGDLHLRQSHPLAARVLEGARKSKFGLSHNAVVDMTEDETEVTNIVSVNSVDLVDDPATTRNLYESEDIDMPEEIESSNEITAASATIESLSARMESVEARLSILESAGKHVAESKSGDLKPIKRLTALETKDAGDADAPQIGNSHDAFMDVIRGFPILNEGRK